MNMHDDEIDKLLAAAPPAGDARFTFRIIAALPPRRELPRWAKHLPAVAAIASLAVATVVTGANGFGLRLADVLVEPSATPLAGALGLAVATTCLMFVSTAR